MNYETLIATYPFIDSFLQLFNGIMPTIVALLAIYINNNRAWKRDKNKEITEMKRKTLLVLEESSIQLYNMAYNVGKEYLDYMQHLKEKDKKEKYFNLYYENNKDMLMFSRKVRFLSESAIIKTGIDTIEFDSCFRKVSDFAYGISCISEAYYDLVNNSKTKREEDHYLDQVQKELIIISEEVENEILNYIKGIASSVKNLI